MRTNLYLLRDPGATALAVLPVVGALGSTTVLALLAGVNRVLVVVLALLVQMRRGTVDLPSPDVPACVLRPMPRVACAFLVMLRVLLELALRVAHHRPFAGCHRAMRLPVKSQFVG